jgi:hypothetical protein
MAWWWSIRWRHKTVVITGGCVRSTHQEMRHMRMRKTLWRITSCYYPSWKHSHSLLADYTLVVEQYVASTHSSPVVSSPPHRAGHAHPPCRYKCMLKKCLNWNTNTQEYKNYCGKISWKALIRACYNLLVHACSSEIRNLGLGHNIWKTN